MEPLRFDVFGRILEVRRDGASWSAWAIGSDGKRGPANLVIPDFLGEDDIAEYLFDLFHESATQGRGDVKRFR